MGYGRFVSSMESLHPNLPFWWTPRRLPFLLESCWRCFLNAAVGTYICHHWRPVVLGGGKPEKNSRTGTRWKMNGWNVQITHLEREMIFQTSMIIFHVNLQGCILFSLFWCGTVVFCWKWAQFQKVKTWSFSWKLSSCCLPVNRWHGWRPWV